MSNHKQELIKQGKADADIVVNNPFIDGLSEQLALKQQYGLSFPSDYNPTNALTGAYLILKETVDKNNKPLLESCSQASIATALMDMVTLGLNANKKQGYFISYGGKCHFQKSYFGNITIAKRNGLRSIAADVIYEGDVFKYHKHDAKTVIDVHEQNFENIDNDKIVGAYAVAIMNDGTKYAEVMNINQLKKAWGQRMGGLKDDSSSTHSKFPDQMAKRTVINRLCKIIANTSTDGEIAEVYEKLEELENVDVVAADIQYEIEENANSEQFVAIDDEVIPEINEPDFMKE